MSKVSLLDRIEKIEKEVAEVKKTLSYEEKDALEAIEIFEREKAAGKLKILNDPKELLK